MKPVGHPTHNHTNQVDACIWVCSFETEVHTPVEVSHTHVGTAEPDGEIESRDEKNQGKHGGSFRNSRNCCRDKNAVTMISQPCRPLQTFSLSNVAIGTASQAGRDTFILPLRTSPRKKIQHPRSQCSYGGDWDRTLAYLLPAGFHSSTLTRPREAATSKRDSVWTDREESCENQNCRCRNKVLLEVGSFVPLEDLHQKLGELSLRSDS